MVKKKIRIIGEDITSILKNHLDFECQGMLTNEAISILVNTYSDKITLSEVELFENWLTVDSNDSPSTISLEKDLESDFYGMVKKWITFERKKNKEFERAIQSIENSFKSKNYILPIHWDQFYYGELVSGSLF